MEQAKEEEQAGGGSRRRDNTKVGETDKEEGEDERGGGK